MMSIARRIAVLAAILAWSLVGSGCFYQDYDLMTVDHYSHYGHEHHTDTTFYHSDGCDD